MQVKDILYHLYMTARGNLQRLMPKEIRILKHLLTIEDPDEQLCALKDAFTPGAELEGKDVDSLYTYVFGMLDMYTRNFIFLSAITFFIMLMYFVTWIFYFQNSWEATYLDKNRGWCLPFQQRRHSYQGSQGFDEPEDHTKTGGTEETSPEQFHVNVSSTSTPWQELLDNPFGNPHWLRMWSNSLRKSGFKSWIKVCTLHYQLINPTTQKTPYSTQNVRPNAATQLPKGLDAITWTKSWTSSRFWTLLAIEFLIATRVLKCFWVEVKRPWWSLYY